jgi:hypothetical protein
VGSRRDRDGVGRGSLGTYRSRVVVRGQADKSWGCADDRGSLEICARGGGAGSVTSLALGVPGSIEASSSFEALVRFAETSALFGVLYVGAVTLLHRSWEPLYQIIGLLRVMVPWDRPATKGTVL